MTKNIARLLFISLIFISCDRNKQSLNHTKHKTVVVTFSILKDFVQQVVKKKNNIKVICLIPENKDPHTFEPTPKDCLKINNANLIIANGLDLEPWLDRLLASINYKKKYLTASKGVTPLRRVDNPSMYDPHAWHDVSNAIIYVKNIADTICQMDPDNRYSYQNNAKIYCEKLKNLDKYVRFKIKNLKQKNIITTHDAFWYYGRAYGLSFLSPMGVSTEEEPSALHIARLIDFIKKTGIKTVFLESLTNPTMIKQIAKETGAKIGGVLYTDSLCKKCPSYIYMIINNTKEIVNNI